MTYGLVKSAIFTIAINSIPAPLFMTPVLHESRLWAEIHNYIYTELTRLLPAFVGISRFNFYNLQDLQKYCPVCTRLYYHAYISTQYIHNH